MIELVFATNNKHKLEEIKLAVGRKFRILSLSDINCNEEIPETKDTLEGNASQKSAYIYQKYGLNCFADDTGLEIESLNGEPGVYSARYAGSGHNHEKYMDKVLKKLTNIEYSSAQFRTVISLVIEDKEVLFEGKVKGKILQKRQGNKGFGYDPIFQADGHEKSFAEMDLTEKNKISHRGKAVSKLIDHLNGL